MPRPLLATMAMQKVMFLAVLVLGLPLHGTAYTSQDVNEANNPLTPKLTVNLQDQYISSYYGLDSESNAILLRGVLPHKLFDWPQIVRATVPVVTSPDQPVDPTIGRGRPGLALAPGVCQGQTQPGRQVAARSRRHQPPEG